MSTIIVDIDGTVADLKHRRHFVASAPKNWKAFFAAVTDDEPITPVINVIKSCILAGAKVVFVTGRPDSIRDETVEWLRDVAGFEGQFAFNAVLMRATGDFRPDDIVKEELLDQLLEEGFEPVMVFDDRKSVVGMWRRRGLICAQVAEGDF
jgi:hypothetical protein